LTKWFASDYAQVPVEVIGSFNNFWDIPEAEVEIDEEIMGMSFITNNLALAPSSICDLIEAAGELKCFSNRSSKPSSWLTFWVTTKTRFAGRSGPPFSSTYCFVS
jgi:hypothetical protein